MASESMKSSSYWAWSSSSISDSSFTTRRGEALFPRESPEPSTSRAPDPSRRAKPAATLAPAAVLPRPRACSARSLSSISAKKLSEVLLVSAIRRPIGGESTLASTSAPAAARPARGAKRTFTPRRSSAASSWAAANSGGLS